MSSEIESGTKVESGREEFSPDFDFDFTQTLSGLPVPFTAFERREVREADLVASSTAPLGVKSIPLAALRESHHNLARVLAEGASNVEASARTGLGLNRISVLKSDPSFSELLSFYSAERREIFIDVNQRVSTLSSTAMEVLLERMDEAPEEISTSELRQITSMGLDRTGHGPMSKTVNHNVSFTAAELAEIKSKTVRDVTPESERVGLGGTEPERSEGVGETAEAERAPRERDSLREQVRQVAKTEPEGQNLERNPL